MNWRDRCPASVRWTFGAGWLLVGLVLWCQLPAASAALAGSAVLAAPGDSDSDLLALVGWMVGGAAVLGAVAWAGTSVVDLPVARTVAVGLAAAAGGGTGAAVRLVSGEPEIPDDETVTIDRERAGDSSRTGPKPADLFARSPDPMLYYGTEGDTPVVRTVNSAFAETFEVARSGRVDAPLAESLPAGDVDAVLAAVREGEPFEATIEGRDGSEDGTLLLRVIGVADETGARGYVVYTALDR